MAAPEKARIVSRPRVFADPESGAIAGLWKGGRHGVGTQKSAKTDQCHDITVFPSAGLAAGACSGNGILFDISDPVHPVRLDQVIDKGFAYWHSATFNNDGTKVVSPTSGAAVCALVPGLRPKRWGANAIFDIVDRKLQFRSYYKLPAPQSASENCVAHNGSLVPVPGRDVMVQAWYQGGASVFDFTDLPAPVEIAYFDRGPIDAEKLIMAGYWSTYWHQGYVYGAEIARGLDVLKLLPSEYLTPNGKRRGLDRRRPSSTRSISVASNGRPTRWWRGPISTSSRAARRYGGEGAQAVRQAPSGPEQVLAGSAGARSGQWQAACG